MQPPTKTEKRAKEPLLLGREQVVAPLDCGAQCLLAGIGVAAALQEVESLGEPLQDLLSVRGLSCARPRARRRAAGRRGGRRARRSPRLARAGSARRRARRPRGEASGGTAYSTSPLNAQELAARDEQSQVGTGAEERRELGSNLDHVLEVVEQEQHLPLCDVLGEPVVRPDRLGRSSRVTSEASRSEARPTQKTPAL